MKQPLKILQLAIILLLSPWAAADDEVNYTTQIRPLLSDRCYSCHGPDAAHREADLRLDQRESAMAAKAVVPGQPDASGLVARIHSTDPDLVMPPPDSGRSLNDRERQLLKDWIQQGGTWEEHWAYAAPVRPDVPDDQHPVDFLVRQRLEECGLQSVGQADPRTLVRRVFSDLIGLPPTMQQLREFTADPSPHNWEMLVDELLQSPHYGERMAIPWLDVVRFSDTIGYHSDVPRNIWPYRDWVISSFNTNKPFDQFTVQQLAGDLLPQATADTRLGSAFNRLLLTTEEGGAQPKDYESRMLADRVRAVGTVWLGQTIGCAQCHDHKFDPITMQDFYSLGAFFADIAEPAVGRREAGMRVVLPDQESQLEALERSLQHAREKLAAAEKLADAAQDVWEQRVASGDHTITDEKMTVELRKQADAIARILKQDSQTRSAQQRQQIRDWHRAHVFEQSRQATTEAAGVEADLKQFRDALPQCLVSVRLDQRRPVRILPRGDWMDESGPLVNPALPSWLPGLQNAPDRELTRLDLANWLVSGDNPLTARTIMNRLWGQFFGNSLSRVPEDLGAQGEAPLNPQLLDFLACEFVDSGWDFRHMVRLIVTSGTYQLASEADDRLWTVDPDNREYARQSALRRDAELIRDYALSAAGLLSPQIGGRSIRPYQPDGYWEHLNFPKRKYQTDDGDNLYRRGLYVWWQRTFLHPGMLAFDAPNREECCAQRSRSNIPQQALVLLNDPIFVEAARGLAVRLLQEDLTSDEERVRRGWQIVLQRDPDVAELDVVLPLLEKHRRAYLKDPEAAEQLLRTGQSASPNSLDRKELAAWTHVARVLLNLHESITRS